MAKVTLAIVDRPVAELDVTRELTHPGHGGRALFFGVVRNYNHGKSVRTVQYDCFQPLALTTLGKIADEAQERWGTDCEICVFHSRGPVAVGEISVGVGVSTVHRSEAFAACRFLIDELKTRVPIWKKEIYETGETEWLAGHALCAHDLGPAASGRAEPTDGKM